MKKLLCIGALTFSFKAAFITYDFSHGRFGDNLLSYLHAKWISYLYDIPLLYRPFPYSDQLILSQIELQKPTMLLKKRRFRYSDDIDREQPYIYIVPYFSEDLTEHGINPQWIYFEVDWQDEVFKKQIQDSIRPADKKIGKNIDIPRGTTSVAVHIRRGGGVDASLRSEWNFFKKKGLCADDAFPLKFPPLSFYIKYIKKISELVNHASLYVHIFTDDCHPKALLKRIKKELNAYKNISIGIRKKHNRPDQNVLEDFFAMTKFDCLIRPQSNYSLVAAKIADYQIEIFPSRFHILNGIPRITHVTMIKKS